MSCSPCRRLCNRLILSDSVTFADDTLLIDIPAGTYFDNEKYCIVVAQTIPAETTINATVAITIGGNTGTTYPLVNCNLTPVNACSINTRTRYSTIVRTGATSGSFVLMTRLPCSQCVNNLPSLPVEAPATVTGGTNG